MDRLYSRLAKRASATAEEPESVAPQCLHKLPIVVQSIHNRRDNLQKQSKH